MESCFSSAPGAFDVHLLQQLFETFLAQSALQLAGPLAGCVCRLAELCQSSYPDIRGAAARASHQAIAGLKVATVVLDYLCGNLAAVL